MYQEFLPAHYYVVLEIVHVGMRASSATRNSYAAARAPEHVSRTLRRNGSYAMISASTAMPRVNTRVERRPAADYAMVSHAIRPEGVRGRSSNWASTCGRKKHTHTDPSTSAMAVRHQHGYLTDHIISFAPSVGRSRVDEIWSVLEIGNLSPPARP